MALAVGVVHALCGDDKPRIFFELSLSGEGHPKSIEIIRDQIVVGIRRHKIVLNKSVLESLRGGQ